MKLDADGYITIGKGVTLKPYKPRPILPREYMSEYELRNSAGGDIILDGEYFPNFHMMGFKHVQSGKYIKLEGNFDPFFISWIINSFRSIGFNSLPFDLPMLWASYVNRDPRFLKAVANDLILSGKRPNEIAKEYGFEIYKLQPRQHIDLFNVCPLKGSLKLYGARLHSKRIQELPFPDHVPLDDWQIPVVQEYNCNDLDVTEQIFKFCKERLELREAISIEYDEDLMSKSDAQMAEVVIPKEVAKLNKRWAKRPEIETGTIYKYSCPQYLSYRTKPLQDLLLKVKRAEFIVQDNGKIALPEELKTVVQIGDGIYRLGIGGLHSSEEEIGYETNEEFTLSDRDMVSYYPNILINGGLYPSALGPNFLIVFKGFKSQRVEAKRTKNFTKDKGLKIFINGMSGKLSDEWSKMYSPDLTIQMTVTGQLTLLLFIEILVCNGFKVISANTDGIVIYHRRDEVEKLLYWIKFFEQLTGFETENTEYARYYARDVNAYFAVKVEYFIKGLDKKFDSEYSAIKYANENRMIGYEIYSKISDVKVKGPYSEVGSQSGTQLDNNPIHLICSDAIKLFLSKGKPVEETIRACKDITRFVVVRNVKGGAHKDGEYLGKVVRWAYYKGVHGTINYVSSGNKVAETDGAWPLQDLPESFPEDQIDYDKYISLTKDILYDIGYLKRAKQVSFF